MDIEECPPILRKRGGKEVAPKIQIAYSPLAEESAVADDFERSEAVSTASAGTSELESKDVEIAGYKNSKGRLASEKKDETSE